MARMLYATVPALTVTLIFFWMLQGMIHVGASRPRNEESFHNVDFIRLKREQPPEQQKERIRPLKPKPEKQMPQPDVRMNKTVAPVKQPMLQENLNLDIPLNLSAVSALSDARVAVSAENTLGDAHGTGIGGRAVNTNVIPLSRINPVYPKRAKMMKKEGFVVLEFTITPFGTVKDAVAVRAEPKNMFENSAVSALLKWRFKPKVEDNKPVEQRAMIQMDFRLDR